MTQRYGGDLMSAWSAWQSVESKGEILWENPYPDATWFDSELFYIDTNTYQSVVITYKNASTGKASMAGVFVSMSGEDEKIYIGETMSSGLQITIGTVNANNFKPITMTGYEGETTIDVNALWIVPSIASVITSISIN